MTVPVNIEPYKISDSLIDRLAYSRDASIYRLVPKAVLRPENEQDIVSILEHASEEKIPVTFRTGGTSLSGQSVSEGYIVEVLKGWKHFEILGNGGAIKVQPGLTGHYVNGLLKPYGRKIGPDPASIKAARIGGIIANNSSGMACGIQGNSYHTVQEIRFILSSGNVYDTGLPHHYRKFREHEPVLFNGLAAIRKRILDSTVLVDRIRRKYRLKNTIGYSMNAFLDYEHPLDIFAHLLIGSEGTLAFISSVTFNTLPDPGKKLAGLFVFEDPASACAPIPELNNLVPASMELMDRASLDTSRYITDFPFDMSTLQDRASALLIEFQSDNSVQNFHAAKEATRIISQHRGKDLSGWQEDDIIREKLWNLRKGLYPTVGSLRREGTSVITEDICYDIADLGEAVGELQDIFRRNRQNDAVIFGHARDGNIHFVAPIDLNDSNAANKVDSLMNDLVNMTVSDFDGSLKGEHGTGRNMAPFVELEWGTELYKIMHEVKILSDPDRILNPGVLLHDGNSKIHIQNLKSIPPVNPAVDLCIECGFCETVCPSRELTLTPRQRIIIQREISGLNNIPSKEQKGLIREFNYKGVDTCAVDGLCETVCPVNINTGNLVTDMRSVNNSGMKNRIATLVQRHFNAVASILRTSLRLYHFVRKDPIIGGIFFFLIKSAGKILPGKYWGILNGLPAPVTRPLMAVTPGDRQGTDLVYYPSCLTRTFSPGHGGKNLAEMILKIARLCHLSLEIPEKTENTCCGTPFHSKGYYHQNEVALSSTIELLFSASQQGALPILIDTSPCTNQLRQAGKVLRGPVREKWDKLKFIDICEFLWDSVKTSEKPPLRKNVALHPTCAVEKMGLTEIFIATAAKCSDQADYPRDWGCCGFAGDRGLLVPELTERATMDEVRYFSSSMNHDSGVATSRTCELGMEIASGIAFQPLAELVLEYLQQPEQ